MTIDPSLLSRAVVVWAGWGQTMHPVRDASRLVKEYGPELASDLTPQIQQLADVFYASEAKFTIGDLKLMSEVAASEFRAVHPEISDDAVRALAWCYTYDYR